jgi:hypothetical protein
MSITAEKLPPRPGNIKKKLPRRNRKLTLASHYDDISKNVLKIISIKILD